MDLAIELSLGMVGDWEAARGARRRATGGALILDSLMRGASLGYLFGNRNTSEIRLVQYAVTGNLLNQTDQRHLQSVVKLFEHPRTPEHNKGIECLGITRDALGPLVRKKREDGLLDEASGTPAQPSVCNSVSLRLDHRLESGRKGPSLGFP
jgi:hypothetical protein